MLRNSNQVISSFFLASVFYVALPWISGLLFGFLHFKGIPDSILSQLRSLFLFRISAPGAFLCYFLPISIALILIRARCYRILGCFLFLKATVFSFCRCCLSAAFGQGSWIVTAFFLAPGNIATFIFLLFLLVCFAARERIRFFFRIAVVVLLFVSLFDYYLISPFSLSIFGN